MPWTDEYSTPSGFSYQKKASLLSPNEAAFFSELRTFLDYSPYCIFAMVRIADIITVPGDNSHDDWWKLFKKISSKHVDFVICERNGKILCALELDDSTHNFPNRWVRDAFVNELFRRVNLPLLRFPVRNFYGIEQFNSKLSPYLPLVRPDRFAQADRFKPIPEFEPAPKRTPKPPPSPPPEQPKPVPSLEPLKPEPPPLWSEDAFTPKGKITVKYLDKEGFVFAYAPDYDIHGIGKTRKEAVKALRMALLDYFAKKKQEAKAKYDKVQQKYLEDLDRYFDTVLQEPPIRTRYLPPNPAYLDQYKKNYLSTFKDIVISLGVILLLLYGVFYIFNEFYNYILKGLSTLF